VGFFYFSGVQALYETLKELEKEGKLKEEHIKVLVGLSVDKGVYGLYELAHGNKSKEEVKTAFCSPLRKPLHRRSLTKRKYTSRWSFS
jgi:hypothetical protein